MSSGFQVLICISSFSSNRDFDHQWRQLLAFLGLVFIAISIVSFDDDFIYPFPNCYTLLPTCGAVLIIVFGDKTTFVGSLLSQPLIRGIGLISYSAYLWHQPLFAFLRIRFNASLPISYIIVSIIALLPLSTFSYFYIEQPFRQKNRLCRNRIFSVAAVATIVTFITALFLIQTAQNQYMLAEEEDTYLFDLKNYGSMRYTEYAYNLHVDRQRLLNDSSMAGRKILLIGDSSSQDFYNIIIEGKYLTHYGIRTRYLHFQCPIYVGPEGREQFIPPKFKQKCRNAHQIKTALPLIREANIIILVSLWKVWSAKRLATTIELLNITDQQQLIIVGGKHFGQYDVQFYANRTKEFRVAQYSYPFQWAVEANKLLEQTIDPAIFVNTLKIICTGKDTKCPLFTPEGRLISYDGYHMTVII